MAKLKHILLWIFCAVVILFWLGFGIDGVNGAPPNAIVYVDDQQKTYFAPFCVSDPLKYRIATYAETWESKYLQDDACKKYGYFTQPTRSISAGLLEKIGLLGPLPSRWNPDGTWNWID